MLTSEQMLETSIGRIIKHSKYICLFVVISRDFDRLEMISVNSLREDKLLINEYIDSPFLSWVNINE